MMRHLVKVLFCVSFIHFLYANEVHAQAGADSLLRFILDNKERASLCVVKNDTTIAALNQQKLMPLASTVKLLVAIEFAKQAGKNYIKENTLVPLGELNKYYFANTDGGAHPAWLTYEKNLHHRTNDSVRLIDVARGMMMFSSNANTEFLMDLLGLDNVKNNVQLFGLQHHTAVFPLAASLMLYQNPRNLKEKDVLRGIEALTEEAYCKTILQLHNALKYDTVLIKKFRPNDLSEKMQKLWSNRLPASTTKDYTHLCSILNNRRYMDVNSYGVLAETVEYVMENPLNRKIYKHFGLKNGSTNDVLTEAFYATLLSGEKIEAAYFFNTLTVKENLRLQQWLNDFRIALTQNENFTKKIAAAIGK